MKNITLLFIAVFYCSLLQAQSEKSRIEVGKNFYHFSNTNWDSNLEFNLAYTQQLDNAKLSLRLGTGFFLKEYTYNNGCCDIGNVFDRNFFLFEITGAYTLISNERNSVRLHFGPLYRIGSENQVVNIIDRGNWTDIVTNEFDNSGFGVLGATSYGFQISSLWIASAEVGVQQFFHDEGTPFNYYAGLKIGLLF